MRPRAAPAPLPARVLADRARQVEVDRRCPHGQGESELGAAARSAADRDGAAVGLDDALDDVQTEARPAALAAPPEAGEDTVHGLLRDAGTLVAHGDRRAGVLALAG